LARHDGVSVHFACRLLMGTGPTETVIRGEMENQISALFKVDADIALFYFSGHGHIEATGGYLLHLRHLERVTEFHLPKFLH